MPDNNNMQRCKPVSYWSTRPVVERLAEIQRLRRKAFGENYDKEGIKKVVRLIKIENGIEKIGR
jgi:hypothetical protein